jgi:1-acyl-sn-glycerol-3-phosphate acyltransferase
MLMPKLRGAIFNLGYGLSVALYGTLALLFFRWFKFKTRYRLIASWVRFLDFWLTISCGIRHEIQGLENLPTHPCVIVSNHQSTWETFILQRYFSPQATVLKKELLYIPFFGWTLKLLKAIIIDRKQRTNALKEVIRQGSERLKDGCWVIIFPEGTRVPAGQRKPHQAGGALLAIKAGVPIIPIIHNSGLFWPAHRLSKFPGTIQVVVGKPVSTEGRQAKELTKELENWMSQELQKLIPGTMPVDHTNLEGDSTNRIES